MEDCRGREIVGERPGTERREGLLLFFQKSGHCCAFLGVGCVPRDLLREDNRRGFDLGTRRGDENRQQRGGCDATGETPA